MYSLILCCSRREGNKNKYSRVLICGRQCSKYFTCTSLFNLLHDPSGKYDSPCTDAETETKKVRCPRIQRKSVANLEFKLDVWLLTPRSLQSCLSQNSDIFYFMGQAAWLCLERNMSNLHQIWSVSFLSGWIPSLLSSTCSVSCVQKEILSYSFVWHLHLSGSLTKTFTTERELPWQKMSSYFFP